MYTATTVISVWAAVVCMYLAKASYWTNRDTKRR